MAAGRPKIVDDTNWDEVCLINRYAMFMGYLSMAIRGLGFLVLTWASVVLLGGFHSVPQEDFWCLAFFTFVQTAGFLNMFVNEKLSNIGRSAWGFYWSAMSVQTSTSKSHLLVDVARQLVVLVLGIVHLLALAILLCPPAALHMLGPLVSTGVSLWRLSHLGGSAGGGEDGGAKLRLSLYVGYSLALVHGMLFCHRLVFSPLGRRIVDAMAEKSWHKGYTRRSVLDYLHETRKVCEKDPSLARGRNLITYAVGLMESSSPDDYVSGVRILDVFIREEEDNSELNERRMLVKHLIRSGSASHIVQKLLHMLLHPNRSHGEDEELRKSSHDEDDELRKGLYDEELRKRASRILVQLASEIRLQHLPGGIQCISSLLDASRQEVGGYRELVLQGFRILKELAADEHNCRVIVGDDEAGGLLAEITRPVSSDLLHRIDHAKWSKIVDASLQLTCCLLTSARGDTAAHLRRQISSNREAMRSIDIILTCDECAQDRRLLAMKILTEVTQPDAQSRGDFIHRLLRVFTDTSKNSQVRGLAGRKLAQLARESGGNARIILQGEDIFDCIVATTLREAESSECRVSAAGILEGLCSHYASGSSRNLDEAVVRVTPKVFTEILPRVRGHNSSHGIGAREEDKKLQVALLSLCVVVYDRWIIEHRDLATLFSMVDHGDGAMFSFPRELGEMVERNRHSTDLDCLRTVKLLNRMAISMRRHRSSYDKEDMRKLIRSLSGASVYMLKLDGYALFSGVDNGRTLNSLVAEAHKLLI